MAKRKVFSQTAQYRELRSQVSKQLSLQTAKRTFCSQMAQESENSQTVESELRFLTEGLKLIYKTE